MNLIEKATILHYHRFRLESHGEGRVGALGWKRKESQRTRFEVLSSVGDLEGCSVLDVGCGHGDLKAFLDQRVTGPFTYIGIDQMPEFIGEARRRYGDRRDTRFFRCDFTLADFPPVDYVFASGALGYRCADPDFHAGMIAKMYSAAGRAVAFNMLDAIRFPQHPLLVGHDRGHIEAFCRRLCSDVEMVTGYLEDDFTVFLRRPATTQPDTAC